MMITKKVIEFIFICFFSVAFAYLLLIVYQRFSMEYESLQFMGDITSFALAHLFFLPLGNSICLYIYHYLFLKRKLQNIEIFFGFLFSMITAFLWLFLSHIIVLDRWTIPLFLTPSCMLGLYIYQNIVAHKHR
jgi:hypothetical protein